MTPISGRPTAANRPMARWLEARRAASFRRIAAIAALAGIAIVLGIGALQPLPVTAGAQPAGSRAALATPGAALSASSEVGGSWGASDPMGGLNVVDLATKGIVVVVLLFITLRVLGRMQAAAPKKGGRLQVLESRVLAPKASLHLVAVGERRLVVGLTPSGMVSLAELDAGELEALSVESDAETTTARAGVRNPAPRLNQPSFGSVVNSVMAPIDAFTGRLAALLGGGRVR